jgi:hypothetical protein
MAKVLVGGFDRGRDLTAHVAGGGEGDVRGGAPGRKLFSARRAAISILMMEIASVGQAWTQAGASPSARRWSCRHFDL